MAKSIAPCAMIYEANNESEKSIQNKNVCTLGQEVLNDELLCKAASEIERGEFEADLGQGVCKKRIALPGQGKSGSTRSLVAKQHASAIFFLAGREKSDPGKDFSSKEEEAAKLVGKVLQEGNSCKA